MERRLNKVGKDNSEETFPRLMATCWKQLRESLNLRFSKAGFDITSEQWSIMVYLWPQDGLTQQTLANRNDRSKVAAFKLIKNLEKKGLIIRRRDPVDARCKRVYLTARGRKILASLVPLATKFRKEVTDGVSGKELETFKKVLRIIINNTRS
jgi:DNA-binding MarR family transcriptional regulator